MTVIVNLTSINAVTNEENFNVSNSGWTENTSAGYGTDLFKVKNDVSPVSAFASGPTSRGFLNNTVPASKNQIVRMTLRRPTSTLVVDQFCYIGARMSPGGDDWIGAAYAASTSSDTTGTVIIVKCINGTRTTVMTAVTGVGVPSVGGTATFELRVSGDAPNILVSAWYNGVQVGTTQTVTNSEVDIVGRVGFFNRANGASLTSGIHFTQFYAEDDTGGGPTPILADQGSYSLTGQSANLLTTRKVFADFGIYSLTGYDSNLVKATPGAFVISADSGTYLWEGQGALADYAMNAEFGTYSLSGYDALFSLGTPTAYSFSVNSGTYTLTGRRAGLLGPGDLPTLGEGDKYVKLALLGYTGALNDMLLKYYRDSGATSFVLNEAEMQFLASQGATAVPLNNRRRQFYTSLGYEGSLTDMEYQYWWNL